jgi:hypothetical protein
VFVSGPGEGGKFHFLGSACDLRLRDPLGKVQHTRTFLRSSLYTSAPGIRLLRRLDGCGFFIALPDATSEGSRFEEAEYRLKLTYRLDNTATDANSQIQREAGRSDPETTHLDLPFTRHSFTPRDLQNMQRSGIGHSLGAVARSQFAADVVEVRFHRANRDNESSGDLRVR